MTSHYVGAELDTFAQATNWKKYWSSEIQRYLVGDVLEVGAGLGINTQFLEAKSVASWTCLEPDPELFSRMRQEHSAGADDGRFEMGTTESLNPASRFDVILYIDVLEHIQNDRDELQRASTFLVRGGKIIVLAPAHQWLYAPFDRAIGHYRRYQRSSLLACSPADCRNVRLSYLDSVGMLASIGNRFLLRQAAPQLKQILFWDRFLVPASVFVDRLVGQKIGKSILGVWEKL